MTTPTPPTTSRLTRTMRTATFLAMLTSLAGMSAVDAYLNLKFPVKAHSEENPVAKAVLQSSGDDTHFLISLKLFATALALSLLTSLFYHVPNKALTAAVVVALLYAAAICYMMWGIWFFA